MLLGRKKNQRKLTDALAGQEPPQMPAAVLKLMQLMRDPDSETTEIGEALSWQPDLVVRVLKTVNSAAFGLARQVDSVAHAVAILGRSRVEQLVLGVAIKANLPTSSAPGFDAQRFWEAAFFRAALARGLASRLHPADEATSFTAGLLQDMAVPLLAHARPDYGKVLVEWHGTPTAHLHRIEKDALGWSHDEIGGHLAEAWDLPQRLSRLIQAHHDASDLNVPAALRLVALHRETERELGLDGIVCGAREDYGLDSDTTIRLVEESEQQARDLAKLL